MTLNNSTPDGSITLKLSAATWILAVISVIGFMATIVGYAENKPSKNDVREMISTQIKLQEGQTQIQVVSLSLQMAEIKNSISRVEALVKERLHQ